MAFSSLDFVRKSGITVASDGAEYNKIAVFDPVDATTNPSLVYAAVFKPQYTHLLEEAVEYAQHRLSSASIDDRTQLALDRLLVQVGVQILNIIPGRVSVSVDPRLGYDYDAILKKSHSLISHFDELNIPRSRVLIKIPATYPGIRAAHTLEHPSTTDTSTSPIYTNLTLIFGLVQALACAQAGVSVISPFIGRVKDWWTVRAIKEGNPEGLANQPLEKHPGIQLVKDIRRSYKAYGHDGKTKVMAAGFRVVEEIVELAKAGSNGGPDLVTLPPDLLAGLRDQDGVNIIGYDAEEWKVEKEAPVYFSLGGPTPEGEAAFIRDSAEEGISLDKVPEGLAKFSADAKLLEESVRKRIIETSEVRRPFEEASADRWTTEFSAERNVMVKVK